MAGKPAWQDRLAEMKSKSALTNVDKVFDEYQTAHNDDVGLPGVNGGGMFVRSDNTIDIFSKEGLGIRIDPDTDSISFYCSKFNVNSKTIDLYHDMYALKSNKWPINLAFSLFGACAVGPVTVYPGTIMSYSTAPQDAAKYMSKIGASFLGVI
jgi:hypothetical protein